MVGVLVVERKDITWKHLGVDQGWTGATGAFRPRERGGRLRPLLAIAITMGRQLQPGGLRPAAVTPCWDPKHVAADRWLLRHL